jgi:hypothetical protein
MHNFPEQIGFRIGVFNCKSTNFYPFLGLPGASEFQITRKKNKSFEYDIKFLYLIKHFVQKRNNYATASVKTLIFIF